MKLQKYGSCDFIEEKDIYKCFLNNKNNTALDLEKSKYFIDNFLIIYIWFGCNYLDNYPNFESKSVIKIFNENKEKHLIDELKNTHIRNVSSSLSLPLNLTNYIQNVKKCIQAHGDL